MTQTTPITETPLANGLNVAGLIATLRDLRLDFAPYSRHAFTDMLNDLVAIADLHDTGDPDDIYWGLTVLGSRILDQPWHVAPWLAREAGVGCAPRCYHITYDGENYAVARCCANEND